MSFYGKSTNSDSVTSTDTSFLARPYTLSLKSVSHLSFVGYFTSRDNTVNPGPDHIPEFFSTSVCSENSWNQPTTRTDYWAKRVKRPEREADYLDPSKAFVKGASSFISTFSTRLYDVEITHWDNFTFTFIRKQP
jgi:hypothetical protein